jgi:transcriptional regulator with XRE-family HTH domain
MAEKMTIGQRMRDLRGNRPQIEVAQAIGITAMALSSYETDKRVPRDSIKIKLAEYYKTSVESLFFS